MATSFPNDDPKSLPSSTVKDAPPSALRSAIMSRVKSAHTKPEMIVRRLVHRLGFRYRLHVRGMAGSPDLVFPKRRSIIFVHGCFWHRHEGCKRATTPKTRVTFWNEKFSRNVERDRAAIRSLEAADWKVLVVWECETKDQEGLAKTLTAFLSQRPQDPIS